MEKKTEKKSQSKNPAVSFKMWMNNLHVEIEICVLLIKKQTQKQKVNVYAIKCILNMSITFSYYLLLYYHFSTALYLNKLIYFFS